MLYVHGSPLTGSKWLILKKAASAATGFRKSGILQEASARNRRVSDLETKPDQSWREYCGVQGPSANASSSKVPENKLRTVRIIFERRYRMSDSFDPFPLPSSNCAGIPKR